MARRLLMKYSIRLKLICMMCLLIVIAVGGDTAAH